MAWSPSISKHPKVDEWLSIGSDGRVTIRSGKVDIGQRISTALALIVAEELDVDFERIVVAPADTDASPDEGYSSGSNSMEESGQALRLASATARRHLLARAADVLEADPSSLEVADGLIRSREANRSTTYWDLSGDESFDVDVDPDVEPKSPGEYRKLGRRVTPLGLTDHITGAARYVQDMTMPEMLHARVIRPPHYHARLAALDESIHDGLAGARLVRDGSFLAVAAEDEYLTTKAAARIATAAQWAPERGLDCRDVYQRLVTSSRESLPVVDGIPRCEPVPEPPPHKGAVSTLKARFQRPYQMHASIGPSAALALCDAGRLTIWTHTQGIYPLRASIAEALAMDLDAVRLIHTPGPGCYGHNGADDAALDAALVARAIAGKPVLLKWTRDDEHAWEPYGSCMVVDVSASLDSDGRVLAWSHETYSDTHMGRPRPGPDKIGPSRLLAMRHVSDALDARAAQPNMARHAGIHRNSDPLYAFPGRRIVKHLVRDMPLRTSTMRTLGAYANVFAIESFMDELAAQAGSDPLAFRLHHLEDERAKAVLDAAAQKVGWRRAERPPGRGQGLAFARYKNSKTYAAVAIDLEVDDAASVKLERAVIAADAGQIVDPDGLSSQLEGGLLQAASWTLYEQVTFDESGITSRDWDSYPILRFDNVPLIETILLERPGEPFLGAGEASGGPTAAAIANAIYDATGIRLRRLPFTPDTIRAAALE